MSDIEKLGRFAINANLDLLVDLQDMNDCFEEMILGLYASEGEISPTVWHGLLGAQTKLDKATKHCMILPGLISSVAPNTHAPDVEEADVI